MTIKCDYLSITFMFGGSYMVDKRVFLIEHVNIFYGLTHARVPMKMNNIA